MLSLEQVAVRFPAFALGPVSLELTPGTRMALLGRNASGKSTLLSVMAGRRLPTSGTLRLNGRPLDRHATVAARAHVALVAADTGTVPGLSVREHFALLASTIPQWDTDRAVALADQLALDLAADSGTLSRGSVMKLGLCSAWGQRPGVLLLDEPTAGLDPVARERLLAELDTLLRQDGAPAVVYATHLLDELEAFRASSLLLLRKGIPTLHPLDPGTTPLAPHALALLREDS
jgi:ABC-2 type transport system ATP-binding protein